MEIILLISRFLHILSIVVWLGGMVFQNFIMMPGIYMNDGHYSYQIRTINRRFVSMTSASLAGIFITGIFIMNMEPNFRWLQFVDRWSILLGFKQLIYLTIIALMYSTTRLSNYLDAPSSNGGFDEKVEVYRRRLGRLRTIGVWFGILAMFFGITMVAYA